MIAWISSWLKTLGFGQPAPSDPSAYVPLQFLQKHDAFASPSAGEYEIIPEFQFRQRHDAQEGWLIVYRNRLRGFERDSVDGITYPTYHDALIGLRKMLGPF